MKKIGELLFNRWVLGALIVIALSLVVLLLGDAVAFFDHRPLESALVQPTTGGRWTRGTRL